MLRDPHNLKPIVEKRLVRTISPSRISTADKCLTALEYSLDRRIPYVTDQTRAIGTAYHAGLEAFYSARPEEMMADANEKLQAESETPGFAWDEGSGLDDAWLIVEGMLHTYLADECWWPDDHTVLGVEVEMLAPLRRGWVRRGYTDLVLEHEYEEMPEDSFDAVTRKELILVDHKSARKPWKRHKESWRQTPQPSWYVDLALECFPGYDRYRFVFDVMTLDGKFERREAPVSHASIEGTRGKAHRVCDLIDQGGPYPPNVGSFLCSEKWCDWWSICPFGAAFDGGEQLTVEQYVELKVGPTS